MTALAIALGFLGSLAFAGFVLWLGAQKPPDPAPELQMATSEIVGLRLRIDKAEETLSTHSLALGLGPRRTPEKHA